MCFYIEFVTVFISLVNVTMMDQWKIKSDDDDDDDDDDMHAPMHTYIYTYIHTYIHTMDPLVCYKDSRVWNKS